VLQRSLAIGEELQNQRHIAMVLNTLGGVYQAQGKLTEAEEVLRRSLSIGEEQQDKRHIAMVLNTLGGVYQAQGKLTEAKEVLQGALVICEQQVVLEQSYVQMIRENYDALLEHLAGSAERSGHIDQERPS
jgi:uncharacterized protein HemY